MRKYNLLVFVVFPLLIVFLLFLNIFLPGRRYKGYQIVNYQLEGKNYKLLVADTDYKRQKGLMDLKSLDGFDGMIFVFPHKDFLRFWNKNTYLDLDVYWLDDEKVVGKDYLPSIDKSKEIIIIESKNRVNKVIEIVRN